MLLTSRQITDFTSSRRHNQTYLVCGEVSLHGDEIARTGDFILAYTTTDTVQPIVAQVSEIWQCIGSSNHQSGCVDGILIEQYAVGLMHETYQMPRLHPSGWSLVGIEVGGDNISLHRFQILFGPYLRV